MIRLVFMGTPEFSVPVLESLIESDLVSVVGVVSQPDKEVGRKRVITPSPVSVCAESHGIKLLKPRRVKEEYSEILELNPDIIVTCAYGQIIPSEILDYPKFGCINVHASLLPKHRGGAPIQWSIIRGDKETGVTIMYMDKLMDNGDIISKKSIPILDSDNLESLTNKLSVLGRDLLIETLPSILDGSNDRVKQDEDLVTYSYNISRDDEHLSFDKSAREVFNHVRGLSPNPGCYVKYNGSSIKIYDGYVDEINIDGEISEIVKIYKDGIGVKCKDYVYVITDIKLEGKKRMPVKNYLNGLKSDIVGDRYE